MGSLLFFTGLIGQFWFFIVAGLYAIGVLATPQNPTHELRLQSQLTAEEIVQDFYRNDTQRLMAHGRFLEQKFQDTALWFGESA